MWRKTENQGRMRFPPTTIQASGLPKCNTGKLLRCSAATTLEPSLMCSDAERSVTFRLSFPWSDTVSEGTLLACSHRGKECVR